MTQNTTTNKQELSNEQMNKLLDLGYTRSLAQSMNQVKQHFPLRIWIVDNSSSTYQTDGHRVKHPTKDKVRIVHCTRWEEIRTSVECSLRLATLLQAPTKVRLVNRTRVDEITVACHRDTMRPIDVKYEAEDVIRDQLRVVKPRGMTSIAEHIDQVRSEVEPIQEELRHNNQRISLTIATDGFPTKSRDARQEEFVQALNSLQGLPIWVVIRLCTDEKSVVKFYNQLDGMVSIQVDVLNDFKAEAKEVIRRNPWINYALPLHRIREFGHPNRILDLIDERPLTKPEIRDFSVLLFGETEPVPDPSTEWDEFVNRLENMTDDASERYHPLKKKAEPWINMKKVSPGCRWYL